MSSRSYDALVCRYSHIASFVRGAPWRQQLELWREVSEQLQHKLRQVSHNTPLWLSTDGRGVPWLHVRLDSSPKYIKHEEYWNAPKTYCDVAPQQSRNPTNKNKRKNKRRGTVSEDERQQGQHHAEVHQDPIRTDPRPSHRIQQESKRLLRKQKKDRRKREKAKARDARCWACILRVLKVLTW